MNNYKLAVIALLCALRGVAQNETEILRYSQQYNLGTARSQAAGGAFGAIGADYSSTFINPAGVGLYRRNEFHLSAAVTTNRASTDFLGNNEVDNRTGFNIPSFGMVFTKMNQGLNGDASKGIVGYNFSFGHNRTNDFQQNVFMQGFNNQSNISQFYIERSNGLTPGQIMNDPSSFANLGYQAYITDTAGNNTSYYSPWFDGANSYRIMQAQTITRRGATDEYNFNAAMNIGDVVYLGAGLVLNYVRHEYTSKFHESDPNGTVSNSLGTTYNSSDLNSYINTNGNGVAGRFGVIVRPIDVLRLGISAQTRMRINMTERYRYETYSSFNFSGFGYNSYTPGEEYFEYQVVTPARYTASAALMLPSLGFLSADVDMIDYSSGQLKASNYVFTDANNAARNSFQQAYALRLGAEFKLADYYRLRGGYSLYTSPYKNNIAGVSTDDLIRQGYSLGFGYTDGEFFIDLAGIMTKYTDFNTPYVLDNGYTPVAVTHNTMLNFVVTGGIRF